MSCPQAPLPPTGEVLTALQGVPTLVELGDVGVGHALSVVCDCPRRSMLCGQVVVRCALFAILLFVILCLFVMSYHNHSKRRRQRHCPLPLFPTLDLPRRNPLLTGHPVTANLSNANSVPIVNTTRYGIGSISKLFAATLLWQAASDGLLVLDDVAPVPAFSHADGSPTNVTWRQLVTHLAGLGREVPCVTVFHGSPPDEPDCELSTADVLARMTQSRIRQVEPTNVVPRYSNFGFALIGNLVAERVMGYANFWQAVQKRILAPLGMHNTGYFSVSHV